MELTSFILLVYLVKSNCLAGASATMNTTIMSNVADAHPSDEPSIAKAPFDNEDEDSDLILQTSDNVHFYVHKLFLKKSSSVFADIFTVAREGASTASPDTLPGVSIEEDSPTVDSLLRICYPVDEPKEASLDEVENVLRAALKYDIRKATTYMKKVLLSFIPTQPLAVYARACALDLEEEACEAAEEFRKQWSSKEASQVQPSATFNNKLPANHGFAMSVVAQIYHDDLNRTTAGQLHRLIQFMRSGTRKTLCSPSCEGDMSTDTNSPPRFQLPLRKIPNPDLILRSIDNVDIPTHSVILACASASILACARENNADGLPVIQLEEDGQTLDLLVNLCHPFAQYRINRFTCRNLHITVSHIARVTRAAKKYEMTDVVSFASNLLADLAVVCPIEVYFEAKRYGWKTVDHLIRPIHLGSISDIESHGAYTKAMEFVPASTYHNLIQNWYAAKEDILCDFFRRLEPKTAGVLGGAPNQPST